MKMTVLLLQTLTGNLLLINKQVLFSAKLVTKLLQQLIITDEIADD